MSNFTILVTTLGVTLGIGGITLFLFPFLQKKGVNTQDILEKADNVLDATETVTGVADKLSPNNPVIDVLKIVEKYAHIGVHQAQQLYISSQLPKENRNIKAKETIDSILQLLKIEKTPEIEAIINGAIECEVLALGHSDEQTKAIQTQLEQTNQQLQGELEQQTAQLQQLQEQHKLETQNLQAENEQLKTKLSQVQSVFVQDQQAQG